MTHVHFFIQKNFDSKFEQLALRVNDLVVEFMYVQDMLRIS